MTDLLTAIEEANIVGRGGAGFPAHLKWKAVRDTDAQRKYVIVNISEHEPRVMKDRYIIAHHADIVFQGIRLAMETVGAQECVLNFNNKYYDDLKEIIDPLIKQEKENGITIRVFDGAVSYINGEETALLNAIEGKRVEPRLRPPFPGEAGLYGMPTLVHNPETLYDIALVANNTYENKRFYSVSGFIENEGVYLLPSSHTILQVLEETDNIPAIDFFVQTGGGANGSVFNQEQCATKHVTGTGAIIVHDASENPRTIIKQWIDFFAQESCGKCTPCREGTFQLKKIIDEADDVPWDDMEPILETLETTSFCGLGLSVPVPIRDYKKNVLNM